MTAAEYRAKAEVRSRLLRNAEAQLVSAQVRIFKLECALEFYAARTNWDTENWIAALSPHSRHNVLQINEGCGWDVAEEALIGKRGAV